MSGLKGTFRRAAELARVTYQCSSCGQEIEDGEAFIICGVMAKKIRTGTIARTDLQVRLLGDMLCGGCGLRHLGADKDEGRQEQPDS